MGYRMRRFWPSPATVAAVAVAGLMTAARTGAGEPGPLPFWASPAPHEPFLRSPAAGTVSVFFLTPANPTGGQVRELAERGGFAARWQAVARTAGDGLELTGLGAVQQELTWRPPEVFFAPGVNPQAAFHRGLWRVLFQQVQEHGLGAVLVARDPDLRDQPELLARLQTARELRDPFPCPLPVDGPALRRFELGRGRVAVLIANWDRYRDGGEALLGDWTRLTPPVLPSFRSSVASVASLPPAPTTAIGHLGWQGYEYGYARLAALLRWAAGRDTPLAVTALAATPAAVTLETTWSGTAEPSVTVAVTARSAAWRTWGAGSATVRLRPGANRLTVPWRIPPPNGAVTAEARVTDDAGRLLGFAAASWPADSARPALELTRRPGPLQRPDDDGGLRLQILAPPGRAAPAGGWQVQLRVRDGAGRLVLDQPHRFRAAGGRWTVDTGRWPPVTAWHEALAELRPAAAAPDTPPVAIAETTFTRLPETPPWSSGGFQLGVYGAPERQALHLLSLLPALRQAGIAWHTHSHSDDALFASGGWSGAIATFSFLPGRDIVRYAAPGEPPRVDDEACIFQPALVPAPRATDATRQRWQETVRQAARRGAWFVSLDDERHMPADYDFSPATLAAFQAWLARRYHGDLTALNRAWNSAYYDFDQVRPARRQELPGWPDADRLAPWFEFRLFFSEAAGHWYSRLPARWAATAAPGLPTGEFGILPPVHDTMPWPLDWSRFADCYPVSDYYRLEENLIGDAFRSFNPAMVRGAWMGYEWLPWNPRRRAEPWRALFDGARFAWFWEMRTAGWRADSVLAPGGGLTPPYAELAEREFPDLRGGLDRLLLAARPLDGAIAVGWSFPSMLLEPRAMGTAVRQTLHQLGHPYVLAPLAPNAPTARRLDDARVLILPVLASLSDAELRRIAGFARRGGRVIALGTNGSRDQAGNRRDPAAHLLPTATRSHPYPDGQGAATGGRPYAAGPDGSPPAEFHDWLAAELAAAGLTPAAVFADAAGRPVRDGFQAWAYALPAGRGRLVAVTYAGPAPVTGTLRLFHAGHLSDLRQNRSLGDGDTIPLTLEPGDARVFAILDYRVAAFGATVNRHNYVPGGLVRADLRLLADHGRPDLHALRLELRDPAGQSVPLPDTGVPGGPAARLAPNGRCVVRLPLALDAPPGNWQLHARDLASGLTATASFTVEPPRNRGGERGQQ